MPSMVQHPTVKLLKKHFDDMKNLQISPQKQIIGGDSHQEYIIRISIKFEPTLLPTITLIPSNGVEIIKASSVHVVSIVVVLPIIIIPSLGILPPVTAPIITPTVLVIYLFNDCYIQRLGNTIF